MALARHKGEILHYADELSHYLLDETPLSPEAFGLELGRGKRTEQRQKRRIAAAAAAAAAAGKERASSFARRERDAELMTKTKTPAAEDATQRMSRRLREGRAQQHQQPASRGVEPRDRRRRDGEENADAAADASSKSKSPPFRKLAAATSARGDGEGREADGGARARHTLRDLMTVNASLGVLRSPWRGANLCEEREKEDPRTSTVAAADDAKGGEEDDAPAPAPAPVPDPPPPSARGSGMVPKAMTFAPSPLRRSSGPSPKFDVNAEVDDDDDDSKKKTEEGRPASPLECDIVDILADLHSGETERAIEKTRNAPPSFFDRAGAAAAPPPAPPATAAAASSYRTPAPATTGTKKRKGSPVEDVEMLEEEEAGTSTVADGEALAALLRAKLRALAEDHGRETRALRGELRAARDRLKALSEDVEDLTVLLGESLREKAVTRWKSAARVGVERKRAKTSRDALRAAALRAKEAAAAAAAGGVGEDGEKKGGRETSTVADEDADADAIAARFSPEVSVLRRASESEREATRRRLEADLAPAVREDLRAVLRAELSSKVKDELRDELRGDVEREIRGGGARGLFLRSPYTPSGHLSSLALSASRSGGAKGRGGRGGGGGGKGKGKRAPLTTSNNVPELVAAHERAAMEGSTTSLSPPSGASAAAVVVPPPSAKENGGWFSGWF